MKISIILIAITLFVCCNLTETKAKPTYPSQYKLSFVLSLPKVPEHQPISLYHDEKNGRQRLDYYDGLGEDLLIGSSNSDQYTIRVAQDKQICYHWKTNSTAKLSAVIPDLTDFTYIGEKVVRGQQVDSYQYIDCVKDTKVCNTYIYSTVVGTNYPVQYWFLGYDSIFGSHYDQYVIDYYEYIPSGVKDSDFAIPSICKNPEETKRNTFGRNSLLFKKILPSRKAALDEKFNLFMNKYGKSYSSQSETLKRQKIFLDNHQYIENFNKENSHMKLAINHFADLSLEEYKRYYLLPKRTVVSDENSGNYVRNNLEGQLPESWDWRDYGASPPVKDQSVCGSCWAHSVIGAIESQYYLATGTMPNLSEQMVMDCTWSTTVPGVANNGCEGGNEPGTFEALKDLGGVMDEEDYPYLGMDGYCGFDQTKVVTKIDSYTNVSNNQADVMDAIYTQGVLSIAIDAAHESFMFYTSGVYYEPKCSSTELDHAVLLSGYGVSPEGEKYWLVRNSWSINWGDQGYVKMSMKDNNCGVQSEVVYPTLTRDFI
ncbi:hypothetical protein M0813_08899 [Anaeramoeba flamelloides]|uniref:Uncharacterized protein n=1 Tax=Anaeramoeba flamelloides TaxID=1746091 RepID=A0AAV7ZHI0_9EUKA|nr:hypothetical protein M0812_14298 [Anaeramoeba flamelloides]KAJ6228359.1 hypothetical protein M0813_08899 [Anaeramoeba flamelloides]